MQNKKEEKMNNIKMEFDRIQEENKNIDITKYLAKSGNLPDLGEIQIYDYDTDIKESEEKATEVLKALVNLYLGDDPNIIKNDYIIKKMEEDAQVYADTIFLQRMTKKNYLTQLRQVDNGDNSARMHEVINQSVSQIRENIKFSQTQRSELEKFWKEMRRDLGLNDMSESMEQKVDETEKQEEGKVLDTRSLNDMIDRYLKAKD